MNLGDRGGSYSSVLATSIFRHAAGYRAVTNRDGFPMVPSREKYSEVYMPFPLLVGRPASGIPSLVLGYYVTDGHQRGTGSITRTLPSKSMTLWPLVPDIDQGESGIDRNHRLGDRDPGGNPEEHGKGIDFGMP